MTWYLVLAMLATGVRGLLVLLFALSACTASGRAEQYNRRGEVDLDRGDAEKALESFDRALELRPGYAVAHRNRGRALFMRNDIEGAEKALREAIRLDPREARAMAELGRGFIFDKDKRAEGLTHCQRAAEIEPGLAIAWACVCGASGMMGKTKEAIAACEKAVSLDPDKTPTIVFGTYGRALEAAGRLEDAGKAYQNALRQGPETPELLYRVAGIQARTGKQPEAVKTLQRALELKPDYLQAHRTLAEYYILENDLENARKFVSSARALGATIPAPLVAQYERMQAEAAMNQRAP